MDSIHFQETNPNFLEINKKLTLLNHGIKTTDSETFLELKSAKKSMENMEENITDQMETLKSKPS